MENENPERYESRASITVVQPTTNLSERTKSSPRSRNVSFSNSVQVQDIPTNEDNRMNSIRLEIGSPAAMPVTTTLGTIREEPIHEVEESPKKINEQFVLQKRVAPISLKKISNEPTFSEYLSELPEPALPDFNKNLPYPNDGLPENSKSRFSQSQMDSSLPYLTDGIDLTQPISSLKQPFISSRSPPASRKSFTDLQKTIDIPTEFIRSEKQPTVEYINSPPQKEEPKFQNSGVIDLDISTPSRTENSDLNIDGFNKMDLSSDFFSRPMEQINQRINSSNFGKSQPIDQINQRLSSNNFGNYVNPNNRNNPENVTSQSVRNRPTYDLLSEVSSPTRRDIKTDAVKEPTLKNKQASYASNSSTSSASPAGTRKVTKTENTVNEFGRPVTKTTTTITNEGDSTEPFSGFSSNFGNSNGFGNNLFEKARNDFFGRESFFDKSSSLSSEFGKGFGSSSFGKDTGFDRNSSFGKDSDFGKDSSFGKESNFSQEKTRNNTRNTAQKPRIQKPARSSNVTNNKFQVNVPVEDYEPHEIEIKLLERAKEIEICAKHADENGTVTRVFTQKYTLPDNAETSELTSLFQDGHLKIMCPLKERQEPVNVPIQRF